MQCEFHVHVLRFRATVTSELYLPAAAGAALRGALFGALRRQFCLPAGGPDCGRASLVEAYPVCFLLAPVDESNAFGRDVVRPYVLRVPPTMPRTFARDQPLEFALATFGRALGHFPYALLGIEEMGRQGLGVGRRAPFGSKRSGPRIHCAGAAGWSMSARMAVSYALPILRSAPRTSASRWSDWFVAAAIDGCASSCSLRLASSATASW